MGLMGDERRENVDNCAADRCAAVNDQGMARNIGEVRRVHPRARFAEQTFGRDDRQLQSGFGFEHVDGRVERESVDVGSHS